MSIQNDWLNGLVTLNAIFFFPCRREASEAEHRLAFPGTCQFQLVDFTRNPILIWGFPSIGITPGITY